MLTFYYHGGGKLVLVIKSICVQPTWATNQLNQGLQIIAEIMPAVSGKLGSAQIISSDPESGLLVA